MKTLLPAALLCLAVVSLHAQTAGSLDPTFGNGGTVITSVHPTNDAAYGVVAQPDGKIIVAGYTTTGSNNDFALVRYNNDGSLDNSFGTAGVATTDLGTDYDIIYAIALQSDGKIVAAGSVYSMTTFDGDFAVARYNVDGSLDTGFGNNGFVTTDFGTIGDAANALVIQPDGKILVTGLSYDGTQSDFVTARYNADGSLDNGFNGSGKLITDFASGSDVATGIAVQADGKIVLGGYTMNGAHEEMGVARFFAGGSVDVAFGSAGRYHTTVGNADAFANAVAVQPDGKIILAGYASNTLGENDFAMVRLTTSGALDNSFDTDGKVTTDFGTVTDAANAMVLQPDGTIILAGKTSAVTYNQFALARYATDGSLDNAFGVNGKVKTNLSTSTNYANAVALQADGKIVAAGTVDDGTNTDFGVARYFSGLELGVIDVKSENAAIHVYPNPIANRACKATYELQQSENVSVELYALDGRLVQTVLRNEHQQSGKHTLDMRFENVASGQYMLRVRTNDNTVGVQLTLP